MDTTGAARITVSGNEMNARKRGLNPEHTPKMLPKKIVITTAIAERAQLAPTWRKNTGFALLKKIQRITAVGEGKIKFESTLDEASCHAMRKTRIESGVITRLNADFTVYVYLT
jgi:hypothetical protein